MKVFKIVFIILCSIPFLYSQDFSTKVFDNYYIDEYTVKDFDNDGDLDIFGIDFPFSLDATLYLFLNEAPFFSDVKKDTNVKTQSYEAIVTYIFNNNLI